MLNIKKLKYLSTVNKICIEIENHLGETNKDLAEFVISLCKESKDEKEFKKKLYENEAEFSESFIQNLFKLINLMSQFEGSEKNKNIDITKENIEKSKLFPSLSIPDKEPVFEESDEEDKKKKKRKIEQIQPEKKQKKEEKKHKEEKSFSEKEEKNKKKKIEIDKLEIYKIYEGKVTGLKNFGFFAVLERDLEGNQIKNGIKREGLCHISKISEKRIEKPEEVVKRGDVVFVKVLNLKDDKINLSMRDVDQKTGEDLDKNQNQNKYKQEEEESQDNLEEEEDSLVFNKQRNKKDITDYELYEYQQLGNSGLLGIEDRPEFDEVKGLLVEEDTEMIENDVEINTVEPNFLKGQTRKTGYVHEPLRLVVDKDGKKNK
jgi:ATP-dependent RNA helicase DHX8/PRP22